MRILHVVPTYLPATRYGGPIYSVHGLCAALARRGHDVHVYTTNIDGPGVSPVPLGVVGERDGVRVTYFPTGLGRRLYRSPFMGVALRGNLARFDLVQLHSVFLWPTAVAASVARRAGIPYVLSPRGMLVPELINRKSWLIKSGWIELFERRNLTAAAAVHVTSEIEAEDISRLGLNPRRIAIIPNGIELPTPADLEGASHDFSKPMVLCLGRVSWKKGIDRLLLAMALVPGAHLVIAGNDEEDYTSHLKALAQRSGVKDRTHFVGPVYGAEKWRILTAADVFVLPSHSENFGIAVLEAMAAGVPVVVTPEVGIANAVAKTGAGLVVDGDANQIAEAITRLIANPDLRHQMGAAGRKAAHTQFSWAAIAEQTEALYTELKKTDKGEVFMTDLIAGKTTAMVITYNEAPNLSRCLDRLGWAGRVLMVDSGSADETLEIARRYPNVDVVQRQFDTFAVQCNFGLSQITTPWVLSLDADYELSAALVEELLALRESDAAGYSASFVYRVYNRSLRGSLYPPRVVLYRRQGTVYCNDGHGHRVVFAGSTKPFTGPIFHDDRKPLSRWLASQQRYALQEAEHLVSANRSTLTRADRIRLAIWPAPFAVLAYVLLVKGCILDGWPGWLYAFQRLLAETMVSLAIVDARLKRRQKSD